MSNWCNNRLVITGQSVFVDTVQMRRLPLKLFSFIWNNKTANRL